MPYIKQEDRARFADYIKGVVNTITEGSKSPYILGEYYGYFVNRVIRRYQKVRDVETETYMAFGARAFPDAVRKSLTEWADKIAVLLDAMDPINSSGKLHYVIAAVSWGITGDAKGVKEAGYGFRAYLKGFILKIIENTQPITGVGNADAIMSYRRHLIVKAVLDDVLIEWYRRKTSLYENKKKEENGDVWKDGELC